MRKLAVAAAVLAAGTLLLPSAQAAPTALVLADPAGDANFSGLHGGAVPSGTGSQDSFDITSVTFDTVKTTTTRIVRGRRVRTTTPTGVRIALHMKGAPSTAPGSSYGINATHSACDSLRLQIYYGVDGSALTYGDLQSCGNSTDPGETNPNRFTIAFSPVVSGGDLVIQVSFRGLPREFKVGSTLSGISAYTSTAEPLVAGYQPTDVNPDAGIDIVTTDRSWKVA